MHQKVAIGAGVAICLAVALQFWFGWAVGIVLAAAAVAACTVGRSDEIERAFALGFGRKRMRTDCPFCAWGTPHARGVDCDVQAP